MDADSAWLVMTVPKGGVGIGGRKLFLAKDFLMYCLLISHACLVIATFVENSPNGRNEHVRNRKPGSGNHPGR